MRSKASASLVLLDDERAKGKPVESGPYFNSDQISFRQPHHNSFRLRDFSISSSRVSGKLKLFRMIGKYYVKIDYLMNMIRKSPCCQCYCVEASRF